MHLANIMFNSLKIYFYLLIFIFDCAWVFVAAWAFSSCSERGLLSSWGVQPSPVAAQTIGHVGFSSCDTWAPWLQLPGGRACAQ